LLLNSDFLFKQKPGNYYHNSHYVFLDIRCNVAIA